MDKITALSSDEQSISLEEMETMWGTYQAAVKYDDATSPWNGATHTNGALLEISADHVQIDSAARALDSIKITIDQIRDHILRHNQCMAAIEEMGLLRGAMSFTEKGQRRILSSR